MTNEDDLLGIEHLDHCVDILRQSIMVSYSSCPPFYSTKLCKTAFFSHCSKVLICVCAASASRLIWANGYSRRVQCNSDITPTTFARTSLRSSMKVVAEVVYTCRSFAKIKQWAWNRRLTHELDKDTLVTDDPLGWGTYTYSPWLGLTLGLIVLVGR
jgi:hypothetical protein